MSPRHNPRSDRDRQRDSRQVREDAGGRHLSTWLEPAAAAALAQARERGETIAGFVNRAMVEAARSKIPGIDMDAINAIIARHTRVTEVHRDHSTVMHLVEIDPEPTK